VLIPILERDKKIEVPRVKVNLCHPYTTTQDCGFGAPAQRFSQRIRETKQKADEKKIRTQRKPKR
jgi:hypothetical protein